MNYRIKNLEAGEHKRKLYASRAALYNSLPKEVRNNTQVWEQLKKEHDLNFKRNNQ